MVSFQSLHFSIDPLGNLWNHSQACPSNVARKHRHLTCGVLKFSRRGQDIILLEKGVTSLKTAWRYGFWASSRFSKRSYILHNSIASLSSIAFRRSSEPILDVAEDSPLLSLSFSLKSPLRADRVSCSRSNVEVRGIFDAGSPNRSKADTRSKEDDSSSSSNLDSSSSILAFPLGLAAFFFWDRLTFFFFFPPEPAGQAFPPAGSPVASSTTTLRFGVKAANTSLNCSSVIPTL
ncbi:unnamed protein product [Cuscuta campestris]|uniref:Uncharacterized protein n=1 Tax=Cuscuta campestris TaxID=132261 RepID=A0A484MMW0_9ASTE|nr:unnamed protein product [Cuscuta campestris]